MTARTSYLFILPVLLVVAMLPASPAMATEFQVAQLAAELARASNRFAADLGSARGYNSVRFTAERLGREAGELVNTIHRNRSRSRVSAAFNDVARQYLALEDAFLRANGGDHNRGLYRQVSLISTLYSNLDAEYRFTHLQRHPPFYHPQPAHPGGDHGVPRVPGQAKQERPDRRDYGSIRARRVLEFDHSSPVLQRQLRREAEQGRARRLIERRHGADRGLNFFDH